MKIHVKKDWIKKFNHDEEEQGESIPIGPISRWCGCGNPAIPKSKFCYECFEAYSG